MFNELSGNLRRASIDRAVLFANHLLGAEPAACDRLRPHAGRSVCFTSEGSAPWLRWPAIQVVVTPAGRLDAVHEAIAPDLTLTLELTPAPLDLGRSLLRALQGDPPSVRVSGDAAFAADVDWCLHNVRWDAEHDLAGWIGPEPAHGVASLVRRVAAGLRDTLRRRGAAAASGGAGAEPAA